MSWLNPTRWLLLLALAGALWLGYGAWAGRQQDIGEARATSTYNKAIDQQKAEARIALDLEMGKTTAVEKALQTFKNQQELTDATNSKTVAGLSARLRHAAGPVGRLRDPNSQGCGGGGGGPQGTDAAGAGARADDAAEAGGLFSAGATELFQRLTSEADEINLAYASCRADGQALRGSQ